MYVHIITGIGFGAGNGMEKRVHIDRVQLDSFRK